MHFQLGWLKLLTLTCCTGAKPAWGRGAQAPLPQRTPLEANRKEEERGERRRKKKREEEEGASPRFWGWLHHYCCTRRKQMVLLT